MRTTNSIRRGVPRRTRLALSLNTLLAAPAMLISNQVFAAVTSCGDDIGDATTLRYAVLTANPAEKIDLSALACSKITLQHGAIAVVQDDLTVSAAGPEKLTIDGNQSGRVFTHTGKGTLSLSGLTVANGSFEADFAFGGCVYSTGKVSLTNAAVTSCKALGQTGAAGGGISVFGDLTLDHSSITNNLADAAIGTALTNSAFGGGAFSFSPDGPKTTLTGSTISGNTVHTAAGTTYGGGIVGYQVNAKYSTISGNNASAASGKGNYGGGGGMVAGYSLFMINSTVDNNKADVAGGILIGANGGFGTIAQSTISSNEATLEVGGIDSGAPLSVGNSTIAFNSGGIDGGGILQAGAFDLTLQNSIVADNMPNDIDGGLSVKGSKNLIKIAGPNATLPVGTITFDPKLGPLAWNGGPTRTHAINAASPAIDAADNPINLPSDQRGSSYYRMVGAAPDIGAYEFDSDHVFGDGFGGL